VIIMVRNLSLKGPGENGLAAKKYGEAQGLKFRRKAVRFLFFY
jgi:hypothetical protein